MLSRTGLGDNHAPNLLLVRSRGRPSASGDVGQRTHSASGMFEEGTHFWTNQMFAEPDLYVAKIRFASLKQPLPRNSDGGVLPDEDVMPVAHQDS